MNSQVWSSFPLGSSYLEHVCDSRVLLRNGLELLICLAEPSQAAVTLGTEEMNKERQLTCCQWVLPSVSLGLAAWYPWVSWDAVRCK